MKNIFKSNIPIITFLGRTWMLLAFMLLTNWAMLSEHQFQCLGQWGIDEMKGGVFHTHTIAEFFGAMGYIPPFASAVLFFSLLFIHLLYRVTIDRDIHDGTYENDWKALAPHQRAIITNAVRIGFFIGLCILLNGLAKGAPAPVNQVDRWQSATINPHYTMALDVAISRYQRNQSRYQEIQAMRKKGVPATILFCLHYRESDNSFLCHAHEGSPLTHRTRDEPKGRLPHPEPPYTFKQSAEDAYYVCEHPSLDQINWRNMQAALDKMESFNGFGYRAKGIAAPYLWSGSSLYHGGKYVRDGVFSRTALDQQLGCATILKRMQEKGIAISFSDVALPAFRF